MYHAGISDQFGAQAAGQQVRSFAPEFWEHRRLFGGLIDDGQFDNPYVCLPDLSTLIPTLRGFHNRIRPLVVVNRALRTPAENNEVMQYYVESGWMMAIACCEGGEPRAAVEELEETVSELRTPPPLSHLFLGRAHYDLEDYSAALHSLDESVRRDRPIAALMHRAATLLALDRRTDARRDRDAAAARGCSVQILADFDEDFEDA